MGRPIYQRKHVSQNGTIAGVDVYVYRIPETNRWRIGPELSSEKSQGRRNYNYNNPTVLNLVMYATIQASTGPEVNIFLYGTVFGIVVDLINRFDMINSRSLSSNQENGFKIVFY